jgi:exonuclease III
MKTNSKRRKDLRLATWNVRSLYRPRCFRITIYELRKYKIAIVAIQETRWNKLTPQALTRNGYNIYTSSLANNHEFGTAFLVDSKFNHMVINFTPINERLCVIRIKADFSTTLLSTYMHQQMTQKRRPRINFINSWSGLTQPAQVMTKLVMGVANAKVGRETLNQPTIGKHSLYESTNENDLSMVAFAAGMQMAIKSTCFCISESTSKPSTP